MIGGSKRDEMGLKEIILNDDVRELKKALSSLAQEDKDYIKIAGLPVLLFAAEHNKFESVKELLKNNFSINVYDHKDENIFHLACRQASPKLLNILFNLGQNDPNFTQAINLQNEQMQTPLAIAVSSGNKANIWKLLEAGKGKVNLDERDLYGNTVLHLATLNDDMDTVKVLIQHGADPKIANFKHQTIDSMVSNQLCETIHGLQCEVESPLHYAAQIGDIARLREALNNSEKLDISDVNGDTPLHFAARYGQYHIVAFLVETAKVDVGLKNNLAKTCLDEAYENDHEEVATYLNRTIFCNYLYDGAKKLGDVVQHPVIQSATQGVLIGLASHVLTTRKESTKLAAPAPNHLADGSALAKDFGSQIGAEFADNAIKDTKCLVM